VVWLEDSESLLPRFSRAGHAGMLPEGLRA
jgi:hypothetical protein